MAVIADSSALIGITRIGRLQLLRGVYQEVLVPPAVYHEVVIVGTRLYKPGAGDVEKAVDTGWVRITPLTAEQQEKVADFRAIGGIGKGEAEALALAERRNLLIILDDRRARDLAAILGLEFVGTAAVLLEGYQRGILARADFLVSLREIGKFMWLSPDVMAEILRRAGG